MDSLFSGFFVNLDATALLLFIVVFILTADYIKNRRLTGRHKTGTYGDVYSLRMGQRWVVVLNGFEAVTQALVTQGDSFSDRPSIPLHDDIFHGLGVVFSNGNTWKQQRRFALSTLKYFGFGKKSLEPVILEEFTYVAKEISKPFNPHLIVNNTVANIICLLVFGHRFEYSDEQFKKLMKLFEQGTQLELYNAFPQLMRRLPGPHQKFKRVIEELKDFIRTEVKDHKQKWDPSDLRDYIDYYLNEIQTVTEKSLFTFDEECLFMSVLDLFGAGSETTSTTLRWAFLYMVKYPEIQERVQAEIDSVIGQSRPPSVDDRADLPYTDAVIHEVQRMGNIVPLSLPHVTNRDVHLRGYTIPKGVTIIPNLTSVLFDKREWKTPFTFNPGHFLNEEGKFVKPAAFIPFSAGKRLCLGENLARMELFLFFTSFMQRFTFSMPPGVKPVLDYRFGVTLSPVHYEICAKPRHE
uniref:Cytochrome P450 2J2-like n=1 Tax=Sphaeramia orbicularis TaxID=375764 RepID=A0A673ASZ7_9TELE